MTVNSTIDRGQRFEEVLDRLSTKSIDDYYNPYRLFEWPQRLPQDAWWMSPELTTVFGTELAEQLTQRQLFALSKHESINFYSLNVHGIRELLIEVISRIHTPGFERPSEFFHHFIGEENEHMWFFAEFCRRYGGKLYRQPPVPRSSISPSPQVQSLLVFARILIFEELVDYYNATMAEDARLHETIRAINRIHHQDESRHIAFGRELVELLHRDLRETATQQDLDGISDYLSRYLTHSFEALYSPQVYRNVGLDQPHAVRRALLDSPARADAEARALRKTRKYLERTGIMRCTT